MMALQALNKLLNRLRTSSEFDCRQAESVMSAYLDSMTSTEETHMLEAHVEGCLPCRRQLQGYISLRGFIAGVEVPAVPEDLALETRIRLSHVRSSDFLSQLTIRMSNVLKPSTLPALAGAMTTLACFAFLLGNFGAALRPPSAPDQTLVAVTQARAKGPLMIQLAELKLEDLTVDLNIDRTGKVGAVVVSGAADPELDQWLKDVVLLADFYPATIYGQPISSRLILSFVGVRS